MIKYIFDARLVCASLALVALSLGSSATVQADPPVFEYRFPDSWDGVADIVTDLSEAGNDATPSGAVLSDTVPPSASAGSQSIATSEGGMATQNTQLLANPLVAAGGGFRMDTTFMWDGTNDGPDVAKIIDYAGTEFLQLQEFDFDNGTATLRFGFNDDATIGTNLTTTISANEWYEVAGIFDTMGNTVDGEGGLSGQATMIVNGAEFMDSVTKSDFGDSLDRPIAVGSFSASPSILELHGNIFNPSVEFLVPEPATVLSIAIALASMALVGWRR